MILINLLPHREMARQRARRLFNGYLAVAAIVGALIAGAGYLWLQNELGVQRDRNSFLQAEIAKLDTQIKDVATLEDEIAALKARQAAVEGLQLDRNLPVHLLNEAVAELPDGVYWTSIVQKDRDVLMKGVAQSNERVSQLLRNLTRHSQWMIKPELVEIVASSLKLSDTETRRVYGFTMRVQLARPDAEEDTEAGETQARARTAAAGAS